MNQRKKIDCGGSQCAVLGRRMEKGMFWAEEARSEDFGEPQTALLGHLRRPEC